MILKYFLFALSFFSLKGQSNTFDQENKTILLIRKTIRAEVVYLGFTLLLGLICTSVIIFSFIQIIKAFQVFIKPYENASLIEMTSLVAVLFLSFFVFYYVFKKNTLTFSEIKKNSIQNQFYFMASKFKDGFISGLQK